MNSHADSVEGRREVRLSADVDRRLARRVDAIAKSTCPAARGSDKRVWSPPPLTGAPALGRMDDIFQVLGINAGGMGVPK